MTGGENCALASIISTEFFLFMPLEGAFTQLHKWVAAKGKAKGKMLLSFALRSCTSSLNWPVI